MINLTQVGCDSQGFQLKRALRGGGFRVSERPKAWLSQGAGNRQKGQGGVK